MASQEIVHEIISDILSIDPDLKNIKSELEKLIQELIANKPHTPFTKEFKDSLNQIILDFQQDGADKEIAVQIHDLLFVWLKKHIKEVDHQLMQYVKK